MINLRKRALALYPRLDNIEGERVKKAKRRLDKALTNARGVLDLEDPRARELVHACDFAETIL